MSFKVGDRVILTNIANWYSGALKPNEECVVTDVGSSSPFTIYDPIIWVHNTKKVSAAIYTSWASALKLKNQQLLFDFMDKD